MKYFAPMINADKSAVGSYIDIDVHSDVDVFEKLMDFCFKQDLSLDPKGVVGILISSHFLEMERLEERCLSYIHQHLSEIVLVPIDFKCINSTLLRRLAALCAPDKLIDIQDPKDKLMSNLYMYKVEELVNAQPMHYCKNCQEVYCGDAQASCFFQIPTIDASGNMTKPHIPDPAFDTNDWVAAVYLANNSWKTTFWKIWATVNYLHCRVCSQDFSCIDLYNCCQHPQPTTASENGLCRVCQKRLRPFAPFGMDPHQPNEFHSEVESLLFKAHDIIMANPGAKPCSHSQEAAQNVIGRSFFSAWQPKPRRESPSKKTQKKLYAQRDADTEKMQELLSVLTVQT
ncbi:hypothetical protein HDU91_003286 [Kappamyces sp. JEL0680]|nr:hypothetical protein HDU91_003286 [Kappamyces sp. JEL0680]